MGSKYQSHVMLNISSLMGTAEKWVVAEWYYC